MIKLSEIEASDKPGESFDLEQQWWKDRGMNGAILSVAYQQAMCYIERLEDDRRHLLASVMQLLSIARGEQNYHNGIILKAQHLLATIDQPQHEREAAR